MNKEDATLELSDRPDAWPDSSSDTKRDLCQALNILLADLFALYVKTKNFHWHVTAPHFRDYHLLLDEQAAQILGSADTIAERVRKIGGDATLNRRDFAVAASGRQRS
jgi:starvation-inducible DNA-binding protein